MNEETRPVPPKSGIVYGDTIYWGTLAGAVISIVGSVIAFLWLDGNVISASETFSAIWRGESVADIWSAAGGTQPTGHWYLDNLSSGDAIAMLGIAFAVASVAPGMLWSASNLFAEKDTGYAIVALIAAAFILAAIFGLISIPD